MKNIYVVIVNGGGNLFSKIFFKIIRFFVVKWNNRNDKCKASFLRKLGCEVGNNNRFVCKTDIVGSGPYEYVKIGDGNLFSSDVHLYTHDGSVHVLNSTYLKDSPCYKVGMIKIGSNCFLGHGTIVVPGVTIGNNVIIGTGSVVSRDIPSNCVAAGVPARVICSLEEYYKKNKIRGTFKIK